MSAGVASSTQKSHETDAYGLIPTIDFAEQNGISSIQLFLNDKFVGDEEYMIKVVEQLLASTKIHTVVIHLPNDFREITESYIIRTEWLINLLPHKKFVVLTHYEEGMSKEDIPIVNGNRIAIENSKTGEFDRQHVLAALDLAREAEVPFVFDLGRIMYLDPESPRFRGEVIQLFAFIEDMIGELDPNRDIIHAADKTDWKARFRDCWTYLGDLQGKAFPHIPSLSRFSADGGVIIFEHEDTDLAWKSVQAIEG